VGTDRNNKGQFLPGNGGRQHGSRNRLQAAFVEELAKDFEEHGPGVIKIVRVERPSDYLKIIASVLPKEWLLPDTGPLSDLSDDELGKVIAFAREASRRVA